MSPSAAKRLLKQWSQGEGLQSIPRPDVPDSLINEKTVFLSQDTLYAITRLSDDSSAVVPVGNPEILILP